MARKPDEEKTVETIIAQLDGLDATALGRVIETATDLRVAKQHAEREAFIARVREEAAAIGLVAEQLFLPPPPPAAAPRKAPAPVRKRGRGIVAAQFRSPDGQSEWSGRGKSPKWLVELESQGRSRDEFRIAAGQPDLIEQAKREHGQAA
jgi:DNA-binding protein H-NS